MNIPPSDIMLVCMNGHKVHSYLREPPKEKTPCKKCGAETIYACPNCEENIPGNYYTPIFDNAGGSTRYSTQVVDHPPDSCQKCGKTFPWAKQERET